MSEQANLQEALVKKAAFGNDIDLEKFDDNNEQHVQSTAELSAAGKERLEHVGIDLGGRIAVPALFRSTMRLLRPK